MRQESPEILGYEAPQANRRRRRPMVAGFVYGWLTGLLVTAVAVGILSGGAAAAVGMICGGNAVASLPAFGLMWLVAGTGWIGTRVAFVVAGVASLGVSFALLAWIVLSFHGC